MLLMMSFSLPGLAVVVETPEWATWFASCDFWPRLKLVCAAMACEPPNKRAKGALTHSLCGCAMGIMFRSKWGPEIKD